MLPTAYVSHQIQGRVRIRVPSRRRDRNYFDTIIRNLRDCEGIRSIETNTLTGSVLILHTLDLESIARHAERQGLFTLDRSEVRFKPFTHGISNQFRLLDERLKTKTSGALDLESLTFLGFLIAGAAQLAKKNIWPAGASLLWYAANVLPEVMAEREKAVR